MWSCPRTDFTCIEEAKKICKEEIGGFLCARILKVSTLFHSLSTYQGRPAFIE